MHSIGPREIFNSFFNFQVVALMGIILNIIGSLFLATEAIGLEKFSLYIDKIRKFSKWFKKSLFRMAILIAPIFIIMLIGMLLNIKVLISLFYPIILLLFIASYLIDHTDYSEIWLTNASKEKRIGPIGFIILFFGSMLQMISVIWQMINGD